MVSKSIKKAFELPKSKSEWIITVCGIIYLVTIIYLKLFFKIDPLTATDSVMFHLRLLNLIRDISLAIALSCLIIIGIRSTRKDGFTLKRFMLPVFAILLCLFEAGVALYGNIGLSHFQRIWADVNASNKEYLKGILDDKDMSLSQRSQYSLKYAIQVWQETGDAIKYVTNDGEEIVYKPSLEEIEKKQEMEKANELRISGLKNTKRAYIFWTIIALLSATIGFFTPIKTVKYAVEID